MLAFAPAIRRLELETLQCTQIWHDHPNRDLPEKFPVYADVWNSSSERIILVESTISSCNKFSHCLLQTVLRRAKNPLNERVKTF